MDRIIGKLTWTALETATGKAADGESWVRLGDVHVSRHEITRGERAFNDAARELHQLGQPTGDDMLKLKEEIEAQLTPEELNEVDSVWFQKSLGLAESFVFGYSEHLHHDQGFGLTLELASERTFSWEWFVIDSPGIATKLQESGRIAYGTKATPNGFEISSMDFLTDVSARVMRFGADVDMSPIWRVNILAGSRIWWPLLLDGELVPSGLLEGHLGTP